MRICLLIKLLDSMLSHDAEPNVPGIENTVVNDTLSDNGIVTGIMATCYTALAMAVCKLLMKGCDSYVSIKEI